MSARTARLGDVCEINPRPPKYLPDDTVASFLTMSSVSEEGYVRAEEDRSVVEVRKGYTFFERGDVLVAKITPCFENGKAARTNGLRHPIGFGSTEFHVLRASRDVLPDYVFHSVWNPSFRLIGARNMTGSAGQKRVPADFIKRLEIPIPPLAEQRRIAAILDKADAQRRKQKQRLELLDGLVRSIFLQMFGDPVSNSSKLRTARIGEVCNVVTGNTPPRSIAAFYGAEVEWIKSDNIEPPRRLLSVAAEGLSSEGRTVARFAPAGSTLVTCIAGSPNSIGNCAMTDREVAFNQQINAIVPRSINPLFLYAQVRVGKKLIQAASTGGMKGLVSKSRLQNVNILNPSRALQDKFAARAELALDIADKLRATIEKDTLFDSLQHRAFIGQL